ncbi:MAG: hypothetical protein ABIR80_20910, partial [Opitutaceae bacterium]
MRPSLAFRSALLTTFLFSASSLFAAELEEDNAPSSAINQVKDPGTRKAAPEVNAASEDAQQAIKRMKLPAGLEAKLWAA